MDSERARELLAQERSRIERALAKLGHVDSGEPIPDERLEVLPTAERTTEEEAR